MFFNKKDEFVELIENNLNSVEYFYDGIGYPTITVDICKECNKRTVLVNKIDSVDVYVGLEFYNTNDKHLFELFEKLYDENLKRTIYNFIVATIKSEGFVVGKYKSVIMDFYYDILDMLEGSDIKSTYLDFDIFRIVVDKINGKVDFYKC